MFNLLFFPFLILPPFLPFHLCGSCPLLIGCLHSAFLLAACYLSCFSVFCSVWLLLSWEVGRIAPDEESLVLLKPVVQFSFIYGVPRGFPYIYSILNVHLKSYFNFLNDGFYVEQLFIVMMFY